MGYVTSKWPTDQQTMIHKTIWMMCIAMQNEQVDAQGNSYRAHPDTVTIDVSYFSSPMVVQLLSPAVCPPEVIMLPH